MIDFRKIFGGGGLPGMFGGGSSKFAGSEFISANPHAAKDVYSGPAKFHYAPPDSYQSKDDLDFRKEFAQSMFGGKKKQSGQDSVGRLAVGGGMRRFETNPLMTTPEVGQYAPTPGFSLVQPLKKKHWYS
jgi:hypothetical protein